MPNHRLLTSLLAAMLLPLAVSAQAPQGAPAGATGQCRDGSYWTGASQRGACHGHHGVQTWFGQSTASSTSAPAAPAAPAAAAMPAAPAASAAPAAPKAAASTAAAQTPTAGSVWVNESSKTYHCPSDKWYGKTKKGAYMSEADARAQGYHPDHGKACQH